MAEPEKLPNRCATHPDQAKEFMCETCKAIYCEKCYKLDKAHKSKISPLSEYVLDNYEVLSYLGGGTFGRCFKVISLSDGQTLALKVIKDVDQEMFNIIKKETGALIKLNHKHLVKYTFSFWNKDEQIFLILMELAEGCLLDKLDTITQDESYKYFKQIAEGLFYLHETAKIMHRDLKPGNILMSGDECKICDFGEARPMSKDATKLSNAQGFGTEAFLPPEVFEGKSYGFKADIWAFGIIFYKMLSHGGHPFNPDNDKNLEVIRTNVKENKMTISPEITNPLYLKLLKGKN